MRKRLPHMISSIDFLLGSPVPQRADDPNDAAKDAAEGSYMATTHGPSRAAIIWSDDENGCLVDPAPRRVYSFHRLCDLQHVGCVSRPSTGTRICCLRFTLRRYGDRLSTP